MLHSWWALAWFLLTTIYCIHEHAEWWRPNQKFHQPGGRWWSGAGSPGKRPTPPRPPPRPAPPRPPPRPTQQQGTSYEATSPHEIPHTSKQTRLKHKIIYPKPGRTFKCEGEARNGTISKCCDLHQRHDTHLQAHEDDRGKSTRRSDPEWAQYRCQNLRMKQREEISDDHDYIDSSIYFL